MNAPFASELLGWKVLKSGALVPNTADTNNRPSLDIAGKLLELLGVPNDRPSGVFNPQSGRPLETAVTRDLAISLPLADRSRAWLIDERPKSITEFAQYTHLRELDKIVATNAELRTTLGTDYLITPDVVVGLQHHDPGHVPFLHAAISCKWTIRSDRVQNIRHENNQMIKHRRDRLPHLVTVTAEPLPTRLAAIARGTGEVDAVYHIAFEALGQAVGHLKSSGQLSNEQYAAWVEVTKQGRVRPYSDLTPTLARW